MAAQEKAQVHVLMVTISLQGHMNPMLRLANRLISKGLHVTLATNEVGRRRMLNFNSAAAASQINFQFFSDRLTSSDTLEFIQKEGSKNLSSLVKNLAANGTTFSCVIVNPFLPWAVDVAAEHGLPCAILWIQAFAVYSIYYHFFKSPHLFPSLEDPHEAVVLPGLPAMEAGDLPSFIQPWSPPYYKKMVGDLVEKLDKVRWVLGNSFRELEDEVVESLAPLLCPIRPVGPVVSPFLLGKEEGVAGNVDLWSAEEWCMEWLDHQAASSVIYISFGSISVLSQQKMDSIAKALINCKKPFLWVVKPTDKELGDDQKSGELSSEFMEETKDRGLVVTWCPQEKVLMHKAVACFMTHCGWNSCLEAVVTGVPVITSPEWSDQLPNAKLLVDVLKIGVRLRSIEAEEVESCFREVTDGAKAAELKKKAMEWKEAARKAVQDGGSSHQNLDQFINEITAIAA